MEKRRVVITGVGAVTPIGNTAPESWAAVRQGVCGIGPITRFDAADFKVKLAGEIKGSAAFEKLDKKEAKKMARFTQLAMVAAQEAMADSGLDKEKEDLTRCGVIISSGIGGLEEIESQHSRGLEKGFEKLSPFFIPMAISNMAAGQVAIWSGFQGMCSCAVTACASSTNAVGDAMHYIRDGYADVMLCGGAESVVTPLGIGGFSSMHALSTSEDASRGSIPFDAERGGFVMGEGAGVLMLEEYKHARARGAKIYAEVAGYAANCDAYHMTAPLPDGSGAARCMRLALADAGMQPEDIAYINAHGTGTKMNDAGETAAVKIAFGEHAGKLCMSSTKSMTGHLLGAAGAVEAIFTALSVRDDFAPATINYKTPDAACDLDIVPNEGRDMPIGAAMSNSLGFGGHNACIVLRKDA